MKVIIRDFSEEQLVKGCKNNDPVIKKHVFTHYSPVLYGICMRYTKNKEDAKDLLQDSFIKIFSNINGFTWKGQGSFDSWVKRICVNTSISWYTKKGKYFLSELSGVEIEETNHADHDSFYDKIANIGISDEELIELISKLPDFCRGVFNLFVIENMSHKEISKVLGIPEKTSATRLLRARKLLQSQIINSYAISHV